MDETNMSWVFFTILQKREQLPVVWMEQELTDLGQGYKGVHTVHYYIFVYVQISL